MLVACRLGVRFIYTDTMSFDTPGPQIASAHESSMRASAAAVSASRASRARSSVARAAWARCSAMAAPPAGRLLQGVCHCGELLRFEAG